jgi:transposase-like protein
MTRSCPGCHAGNERIVRNGFYRRHSDSRRIQRFRCKDCSREFSAATFSPFYRQKKRRINTRLIELLASTGSQRRAALMLKVNRKTIARRLPVLAELARQRLARDLVARFEHRGCTDIQFDDLITIEHTKCKPVSVTVVIDAGTRRLLGLAAAPIPASGPLAAISRAKYGIRPDRSRAMRNTLFEGLVRCIAANATFHTDEHRDYRAVIKRYFPEAKHVTHPSKRARSGGQGELKRIGYDPLFSINHTLAMLRANVNRLIRRTWCTSKRIDRLVDHLTIYAEYHNRVLIRDTRLKGEQVPSLPTPSVKAIKAASLEWPLLPAPTF